MLSRRQFLKLSAAVGAGLVLPWQFDASSTFAAAGTPNITKFVDPLISAIPVLAPDTTTQPGVDLYTIQMRAGRFQFHTQLPVTAPAGNFTTWGYGSGAAFFGYLGPTIEAQAGRPVAVKYVNQLPTTSHPLQASIDPTVPDSMMYPGLMPGRATPHLHGGFTAPQYDGHPHSWFTANGDHGSRYQSYPGIAVNAN